jgi:hypothetical protein
VPTNPAGDVELIHVSGKALPLSEWLTTFHLATVVVDPFTYESAWLLETAGAVLEHFAAADCRVGFIVTATPEQAKEFLGPWTDRLFVLCDPNKALVKSMALETLPALIHIGTDGSLLGSAEGWNVATWQAVIDNLAKAMYWKAPDLPLPGSPAPYAGAPAI